MNIPLLEGADMLFKVAVAFGSLALIASLPLARQLDTKTSADENRILILENAWNSAEQQKNTKALDDLLSDSLAYTDYDGTFMNKSEFLASISSPSLHPEQIVNESVTVHAYGTSAVVTGIYREKGTANGHPYSRRGRFTDTWVSENGIWQCVASQSTLIPR
jgi:ketosteroid isomerase-like protein